MTQLLTLILILIIAIFIASLNAIVTFILHFSLGSPSIARSALELEAENGAFEYEKRYATIKPGRILGGIGAFFALKFNQYEAKIEVSNMEIQEALDLKEAGYDKILEEECEDFNDLVSGLTNKLNLDIERAQKKKKNVWKAFGFCYLCFSWWMGWILSILFGIVLFLITNISLPLLLVFIFSCAVFSTFISLKLKIGV